jgi:hypothetical protein
LIESFLGWIGNTGWSIRMLESFWVWPLLEATHTLSIAFFVGTATMMDLRLMGISFSKVRASDFTGRMLQLTRYGFTVTAVTGVLVFYSNPLRYWHNIFFRFKLILLVLAGINIWYFHSKIHKKVQEWDMDITPPRAARMAGAMSIFAWMFIVISGRLIAYNWFDCDIMQYHEHEGGLGAGFHEFLYDGAGCMVPTAE